jgi:dipeptidyl aminopeptidase/acylaminoacyl peptidase
VTCAIAEGGIARSPAWSPDGTRLAFSYQADDKADPELRIYDLQTGDQTTAWMAPDIGPPYADPIREIAWSPSGRYLAFEQGCCPLGPVSIWDLEAAALAGYRGAYRKFWGPDEDVLTLTIPQPVGEFIPIGSGDSTSIALAHPYEISPTVVLTGTAETLYTAWAWLSRDELAYTRLVLADEGKETERTWWAARIVDGKAIDSRQLDVPPLAYDDDAFRERLLPWLPAAAFGDQVWSPDGTWVVFRARRDPEDPWRIYAFQWEEGRLVGRLAEGMDLALAPVRTTWRCPE